MQRYIASSLAFILSSFLVACSPGQKDQPAGQTDSGKQVDPAYDAASWEGAFYGIDVVDANTAFAYGLREDSSASVVLRTTDGGARWVAVLRIADPKAPKSDQDLVGLDFADAQSGAGMTESGVVVTTGDGGATWAASDAKSLSTKLSIDPAKEFVAFEGIYFLDETHGWAVGIREPAEVTDTSEEDSARPAVYRTTDGGATWQTGSVPADVPAVMLRRVFFTDASNGWVVGGDLDDDPSKGLLLRTADGGATWKRVDVDTTQALTDVHFVDAQHGWVVGQTEDQASKGPGPSQILATDDGGTTWRPQAKVPVSLYAVRFADASNGWAVGTDWKIFRTTDGGKTWSEQNAQERSAGQTMTAPGADKESPGYFGFVLSKPKHGWALSDSGIMEFKQ